MAPGKPQVSGNDGAFRPGDDPRRNRGGRPRSGLAFAEMVRRRLDLDKIFELADRLADDEEVPLKDRVAALTQLALVGYAKVPAESNVRLEASVAALSSDERLARFRALPLERQRELVANRRRERELLAPATDAAIDVTGAESAGS